MRSKRFEEDVSDESVKESSIELEQDLNVQVNKENVEQDDDENKIRRKRSVEKVSNESKKEYSKKTDDEYNDILLNYLYIETLPI